jgi:hypothetical protein
VLGDVDSDGRYDGGDGGGGGGDDGDDDGDDGGDGMCAEDDLTGQYRFVSTAHTHHIGFSHPMIPLDAAVNCQFIQHQSPQASSTSMHEKTQNKKPPNAFIGMKQRTTTYAEWFPLVFLFARANIDIRLSGALPPFQQVVLFEPRKWVCRKVPT